MWLIPNLKNHLMTPFWAVKTFWSILRLWFYVLVIAKIIRNMIDTHNIPWWRLENVLSAFKVAMVNRTYSPFEGPGPSIRLGPGPSKEEYVRFTVATLNALRTFSRCHRCILWVSIMFLVHLWSIKSLPESASLISNSSIWSHRVIFEIWYHSHRAVRRVPNSGFWGKTRPSRTHRAAGRLQKYFLTFGSCSGTLSYPTTTRVCFRNA